MELSGSNIKKCLIFQETEFSYISGNGNAKKLLIFQEVIFRARNVKSFLHFGKLNKFLVP